MDNRHDRDNTSITDIANVMLDSEKNNVDPLKYDAHFSGIDNGYQSLEDIKRSRGKEDLPFQEWTAKYHQ